MGENNDGLSRTDYTVLRAITFAMWDRPVTLLRYTDLPEHATARISAEDIDDALPRLREYVFTNPSPEPDAVTVLKVQDKARNAVIARESNVWPPPTSVIDWLLRELRRVDDLLQRTGWPISIDEFEAADSYGRARAEVALMRLHQRGWIEADGTTFGPVQIPTRVTAVSERGRRALAGLAAGRAHRQVEHAVERDNVVQLGEPVCRRPP